MPKVVHPPLTTSSNIIFSLKIKNAYKQQNKEAADSVWMLLIFIERKLECVEYKTWYVALLSSKLVHLQIPTTVDSRSLGLQQP